jgi:RNA polymerase sigma-70 factor (ECF subfamily)
MQKPDFDLLVEAHANEIFAYLWRLLGVSMDAEDCLQETFLRAFRAFHRMEQGANFRAWLYKIATNTALTYRKRRARIRSNEASLDPQQADPEVTLFDSVEDADRKAALVKAVASLPLQQRMAIIMRKYQELSYSEIAEVLGCSQTAARANVYQGMKKLRARFEGKGVD